MVLAAVAMEVSAESGPRSAAVVAVPAAALETGSPGRLTAAAAAAAVEVTVAAAVGAAAEAAVLGPAAAEVSISADRDEAVSLKVIQDTVSSSLNLGSRCWLKVPFLSLTMPS